MINGKCERMILKISNKETKIYYSFHYNVMTENNIEIG